MYDYPKGDYEGLCQFFINSDLTNLYNYSDVNQVWTPVRDLINTGMDQFIPKVRLKFNQYPKWFSPQMRHQVKCMHTLRKQVDILISKNQALQILYLKHCVHNLNYHG